MKTKHRLIVLALIGALMIASCSSNARVGELRTESHSVELDDAKSVRVEVKVGAAQLKVSGGAEKLLESDFTYNVAKMKPEVKYENGVLVVQHADVKGFSSLQNIKDYRNE